MKERDFGEKLIHLVWSGLFALSLAILWHGGNEPFVVGTLVFLIYLKYL